MASKGGRDKSKKAAKPRKAAKPVTLRNTIVTYREIERALTGQPESTLDAAELVGASDSPEVLAHIADALRLLKEEEQRPVPFKGKGPTVMVTAQNQLASIMQTLVARQAAEKGFVKREHAGVREAKLDEFDPGWIQVVLTYWKKVLNKHAWLVASDEPEPLEEDASVALLADWGSGLYGAPVSARTIEAKGGYNLLLHLGDIYYSGEEDEVRERFLDLWPNVPGAKSRALNGNHEMYSGGQSYFKTVLPKFDQKASYFACQNEHWLLAGLDTAYVDHDLYGDQAAWLTRLVEKAGDKRKVVLFSHHQPYSAFDKQGPNLVKKLSHLLRDGRIFAWYWGHEHRCSIYERHPAWKLYGRCIGHGGIPYWRHPFGKSPTIKWERTTVSPPLPGCITLDGPNEYVEDYPHEYGPQGYVTLQFRGDRLTERVHLPNGTLVRNKPVG